MAIRDRELIYIVEHDAKLLLRITPIPRDFVCMAYSSRIWILAKARLAVDLPLRNTAMRVSDESPMKTQRDFVGLADHADGESAAEFQELSKNERRGREHWADQRVDEGTSTFISGD